MTDEQRQRWLAERRNGLGGSDVAAVVRESPHAGPLDVWADKRGIVEPSPETPEQRRGRKLEKYVRELYEDETGTKVEVLPPDERSILRHTALPWVLGTPDGLIPGAKAGVEFKTSRNDLGWGEAWTDQVPRHYLIQCLWYMAITGYDEWFLAALIGLDDFRVYRIKRDREVEDWLIEQAREFRERYILTGDPPPLDASQGAREYLSRKYPRDTKPMLVATTEVDEMAAALRRISEARKDLEKQEGLLENRLKDVIGEHSGLVGSGWRITWKATSSGGTDWKSLAGYYNPPKDLIAKYQRPGFRRFLTNWETKK